MLVLKPDPSALYGAADGTAKRPRRAAFPHWKVGAMVAQMSLPGMPRGWLTEVSLHCRLWGDGSFSGYIGVARGTSVEELEDLTYQCSKQHPQERSQDALRGISLAHRLIVATLLDNPFMDEWEAIEASQMIYGHLF